MKKWEERSRRNVPKLVFSAPAEGGNITHDGYQKIGGYFGTVYIYGVISISAYTVFFSDGRVVILDVLRRQFLLFATSAKHSTPKRCLEMIFAPTEKRRLDLGFLAKHFLDKYS